MTVVPTHSNLLCFPEWRKYNWDDRGRIAGCAKYPHRTLFTGCVQNGRASPLRSSGQSTWLQNGDVLSFLWGTNWIYICYAEESTPPLWSSGQSSWLQIQGSGFDYRRYQIFWEVVGFERGPFKLVSTIEELLGRENCGSGLENRDCGRRDPSRWPCDTLYPQKLAPNSPTGSGRSDGIVLSRTQATEFS
jgi:hypothetical protein